MEELILGGIPDPTARKLLSEQIQISVENVPPNISGADNNTKPEVSPTTIPVLEKPNFNLNILPDVAFYWPLTLTLTGFAFSVLGTVIVSTPSLQVASILPG